MSQEVKRTCEKENSQVYGYSGVPETSSAYFSSSSFDEDIYRRYMYKQDFNISPMDPEKLPF